MGVYIMRPESDPYDAGVMLAPAIAKWRVTRDDLKLGEGSCPIRILTLPSNVYDPLRWSSEGTAPPRSSYGCRLNAYAKITASLETTSTRSRHLQPIPPEHSSQRQNLAPQPCDFAFQSNDASLCRSADGAVRLWLNLLSRACAIRAVCSCVIEDFDWVVMLKRRNSGFAGPNFLPWALGLPHMSRVECHLTKRPTLARGGILDAVGALCGTPTNSLAR